MNITKLYLGICCKSDAWKANETTRWTKAARSDPPLPAGSRDRSLYKNKGNCHMKIKNPCYIMLGFNRMT